MALFQWSQRGVSESTPLLWGLRKPAARRQTGRRPPKSLILKEADRVVGMDRYVLVRAIPPPVSISQCIQHPRDILKRLRLYISMFLMHPSANLIGKRN
jgi:hypothetical protein